ncbi:hypothetical protein M7I_6944 [Glarea lozoyensis 74030]|uniref:Uncharacterized protein n=1 Tax=Glarea lozoyensis (strain ATCC 74030 / MF5533) TaxID=1104152 RepID=H0EVY7_GLAL7|nr:hypothetical protein M7I_6944 [Glarea lozoyensis 74030]
MALITFLDAVLSGPEVSQAIFSKAREHFSDQALVEVVVIQEILRKAYYDFFSKDFATIFEIRCRSLRAFG